LGKGVNIAQGAPGVRKAASPERAGQMRMVIITMHMFPMHYYGAICRGQ
jgi:hypothetical protein